MNKHIFLSIILFFGSLLQVKATVAEVTCIPGELSGMIENPGDVTELKLSGEASAADLAFIASEMMSLASLDMSGLTIVKGDGIMIGNIKNHNANSIPANTFSGMPLKSVVLPSTAGLSIGAGAFSGTEITDIVIPTTVSSVGAGAFAGCAGLTTVMCGANELGEGIFSGCNALKTVAFTRPTALPNDAFYNCSNLQSIKDSKITSVGNRALSGCVSLKEFPFTAELTAIGDEAFMKSGLENVDLTPCTALETVGDWAFAAMPSLTSLNMGTAGQMGHAVAYACPKLEEMLVSVNVTEIPDFAFSLSSAVTGEGILPDGIESIGRYAMSGMSGVKTIVFPETLEFIDEHAMENMTGLESLTVSGFQMPSLGEDVWSGVAQSEVKLTVPDEMVDEYQSADQWREFKIEAAGVEEIVDEESLHNLRARFEGDNLIVEADGIIVENLLLYNPAGQLLISVEPDSDTVVVDTYGFGTRLFILSATLADGRTASLKLAKR